MCGNPSDEMGHRLAIEVARALGPAALGRVFTPDTLRWLFRNCHRRKTRQDRQRATVAQSDSQVGVGVGVPVALGLESTLLHGVAASRLLIHDGV